MEKKIEINEIEKSLENEIDGQEFELESEVEELVVEEPKKILTKTEQARAVMKQAEELIKAADSEVEEVHSVVAQHVNDFENQKATLANGVLASLTEKLESINYTHVKEEVSDLFELSLGTNREKLAAKNITTGRFTALIISAIGTIGTASAWVYFASQKTSTVLDKSMLDLEVLKSIPTNEKFQPMLEWIGGGMTGGAGNVTFGMATLGLTSLFAGFFLYKLRVAMKENKNVKVANKTLERTENYIVNQKESKSEIERVDEHIKSLIPLLVDYQFILNEQNAKLDRVIHIEGELENTLEYHSNSQDMMDDSSRLMQSVEKLITTPVTNDGVLNENSISALEEAKATYEAFVAKIYN